MTQWYVSELSQLTGVSKRTLHHYDNIDLLKPSLRMSNGYRVYSENDLLRLQQIIALKLFEFDLATIKQILTTDVNIVTFLQNQVNILENKTKTLMGVNEILKDIIIECNNNKIVSWDKIIKKTHEYQIRQHK